jgi:oligopeptide/dipeptide ABC transporter ATP-binding protein
VTARPLLEVDNLVVEFGRGRGKPRLTAVDDVTLAVGRGETVAIVGESGSGKSTLGNAILGFTPVRSGAIVFDGTDVTRFSLRQRRQAGLPIQVVFQDTHNSLSPTMTIGDNIGEALRGLASGRGPTRQAVAEMLERVELSGSAARRYPAELSGGQRQRVCIARALISSPQLVVCDEPVSSLDLSIQGQILNLLKDLQAATGVSYLFISHNLTVVKYVARRIVVLYKGQIMETGTSSTVCDRPVHPYTRALLNSVPVLNPELQSRRRGRLALPPSLLDTSPDTSGCPFVTRCPYAREICNAVRPALTQTVSGSEVACHFADQVEAIGFSSVLANVDQQSI